MPRALLMDFPWSPTRSRWTPLLLFPIAGVIAGALEGLIVHRWLHEDTWIQGDAFVWDAIEHFAWIGLAIGLATGIALSLSRNLLVRVTLAALLGIVGVALALTLYSGNGRFYLWGAADRDASQLLIAKPEGWGLYLGGAGAAMLSFIGHLARRCEGKLKLLVLLLMGGTLLSIRAHAFFWDAWGRVGWSPNRGCLSPPAPDAPSWVGSILITFTAFLLCLLLPLAVRGLRSFSKVIPAGLAAINVLLLSSLAWASREMPLTSPSEMKHLAFTYDPEYFVTAHEGETFRLWRIDAGADSRLVRKYRFSRGPFRTTTMTLSPGFAAASTEDGRITLWDLPSFRQVLEIDTFGAPVRTLAISPDGRYLAAGEGSPRIRLWKLQLDEPGQGSRAVEIDSIENAPLHHAYRVEFSPDSRRLVIPYGGGSTQIIELSTRQVCLSYPGGRESRFPSTPAISSDGTLLACVSTYPNIELMDLRRRTTLTFKTDGGLPVAFSPSGHQLLVGGGSWIRVLDVSTGKTLVTYPSDSWRPLWAYSPDGRWLVSGSKEGDITVRPAPGARGLRFPP